MTSAEMQAIVLREVDQYKTVSIPEAMAAVGEEARGELSWECGENVVLWISMSRPFAEAMIELRRNGVIELEPMTPLGMMVAGEVLNMPVVRRPPPKGYAKPHWCPVWLRRPDTRKAKGSKRKAIEGH